MRLFALIVITSLMSTSHSMIEAQTPPSPTTLEKLRDAYRPLLLFAPNPEDPSLLLQLRKLNNSASGLVERDVLIIAIPFNNPSPTPVALTPQAAIEARRRFHIPPSDFVALLVGKDGEEKYRSAKPVSFDKLRDLIDAMPIRQQEARHSQSL